MLLKKIGECYINNFRGNGQWAMGFLARGTWLGDFELALKQGIGCIERRGEQCSPAVGNDALVVP